MPGDFRPDVGKTVVILVTFALSNSPLVVPLALVAGFVGHKHNLAVGTSMLVLSISLPFQTQAAPTRVSQN